MHPFDFDKFTHAHVALAQPSWLSSPNMQRAVNATIHATAPLKGSSDGLLENLANLCVEGAKHASSPLLTIQGLLPPRQHLVDVLLAAGAFEDSPTRRAKGRCCLD